MIHRRALSSSFSLVAALTAAPILVIGCSGDVPESGSEPVASAESALTCVTLQRGTVGTVSDALLRNDKPSNNYGASGSLTASDASGVTRHSLVQWDLGVIPSGATITSATASLHVLVGGGVSVGAHRLTTAFDESTVTWGNYAESVPVTPVAATFSAASAGNDATADLTSLVQSWVDGTYPNHGILVERDGTNGSTTFASSEVTTVAQRPALQVCYQEASSWALSSSRAWDGTCAVKNGAVKCWGYNPFGQLGLGDTANRGDNANEMGDYLPTVSLGTGRTAVMVSPGLTHSCAVLDNGQLKCWGYNGYGQLGLGDTVARGDGANEMGDNLAAVDLGTGRTAVSVVAAWNWTCALLDNAQVKCWGQGWNGQLGLGDTTHRGDGANEMGDNLPAVDLGTGRTAVQIGAGTSFVCALLDNAQVKCWGNNAVGMLGQGDTVTRGDNAGEMGDNLPAIDLGTGRTATSIAVAGGTVCALLDNAQVKCWGQNSSGECGQGDSTLHGDNSGEMGDNLAAVDLGTGRTAAAIYAGGSHFCAVLDNDQLKCWGHNFWGQLGLGDSNSRGWQSGQMGDNLPAVDLGTGRAAVGLALGSSHSCATLDDGTIKCWGYSVWGQVGQGDTAIRGDNSGEMGDNLPVVNLGL